MSDDISWLWNELMDSNFVWTSYYEGTISDAEHDELKIFQHSEILVVFGNGSDNHP